MSIEQTLERIAISSERNELLLSKLVDILDNSQPEAPQAVPAPVTPPPAPAPEAAPAPAPSPVIPTPAPVMPSAPAAPAAPAAPFTDSKGVMTYCMEKYRVLGPIKGGMIQSVLVELGHNNLNSLRPDQYGEFYQKVEAIK